MCKKGGSHLLQAGGISSRMTNCQAHSLCLLWSDITVSLSPGFKENIHRIAFHSHLGKRDNFNYRTKHHVAKKTSVHIIKVRTYQEDKGKE